VPTIKKTALLLDQDLIAQVREMLGTKTTTDTITEALRELIRVRGRARGLERLRRREGMDLDDPEVTRGAWRQL
jgi:Arc/MetJ family transcription regulator